MGDGVYVNLNVVRVFILENENDLINSVKLTIDY